MLSLVGVEGTEGVDVVERVEQEVRVNLVFDLLEFGLGALQFGHGAGLLALAPLQAEAQRYRSTHHGAEG